MKILVLAPEDSKILAWLRSITWYSANEEETFDPRQQDIEKDEIVQTMEPIDASYIKRNNIDFIISYGYKHKIKNEVLKLLPDKVINLHISYLPYNRGADPNFWSWLEDTPKGVTIHYVDGGVDTGDIIFRKSVQLNSYGTLRTTYEELCKSIEALFFGYWPSIRAGLCPRQKQGEGGTFHKKSDLEKYRDLLADGWDTEIWRLMR